MNCRIAASILMLTIMLANFLYTFIHREEVQQYVETVHYNQKHVNGTTTSTARPGQ